MVYLIIYLVGVLYFIKPIEGFSFRENTTYALLWPLVITVVMLGILVLTLACKYEEVRNKIW